MKKTVLSLYWGMVNAWPMLIDPPLPDFFLPPSKVPVKRSWQLAAFPLLGGMLGTLWCGVGAMLSGLFNSIAGALIFALGGVFLLEWKESGRGAGTILYLCCAKMRGFSLGEALEQPGTSLTQNLENPAAAAFFCFYEILRFGMLFLLSMAGAEFWAVAVLVGSFTVQSFLMLLPNLSSGKPFVAARAEDHRGFWIGAGFWGIFLLLLFPFGTLAAALLVWGGVSRLSKMALAGPGGITADRITLCGCLTENLMLLTGIFFALRAF